MATLPNIRAVAVAQDLEYWWYPVWDNMLQVYVAAGYVGTANLAIGPQAALRSAGGGAPYRLPDFVVFETPRAGGGAAGTKTLRMVMECKRRNTPGQLFAAALKVRDQMNRAVAAVNDPPTVNLQRMFGIATGGFLWTFYFRTLNAATGVWGPPVWGGNVWTTATALNTQVVI